MRGSVVVDLHKLNKIHEVSEKYAYALVEPGVSFFDLFEYIKKRNLKVWISSPALGWGSIIGNSLDRGWGYTPNGDNCSHICGLEVVMADGSILRTGMGQLDQAKCWQLFKNGYGPGFDGLFNQSNYGIVVKMVNPMRLLLIPGNLAIPCTRGVHVLWRGR
jgi:4-cresol dehydrogenase (hydroxylating) flavoprotein subunit